MKIKSCRSMTMLICAISISNIFSWPFIADAFGDDEYYRIKLVVTTDSDWTKIEPLPPWDIGWIITESKIIAPEKDQNLIKLNKFFIRAPASDDILKKIEFIVYFKAQTEDMEFIITRGDIGSTRVEAYNISSDKPYRIGTYTHSLIDDSGKNPSKFKMSVKKIAKYGTVKFTPSRKGKKR